MPTERAFSADFDPEAFDVEMWEDESPPTVPAVPSQTEVWTPQPPKGSD